MHISTVPLQKICIWEVARLQPSEGILLASEATEQTPPTRELGWQQGSSPARTQHCLHPLPAHATPRPPSPLANFHLNISIDANKETLRRRIGRPLRVNTKGKWRRRKRRGRRWRPVIDISSLLAEMKREGEKGREKKTSSHVFRPI